jgi:predicted  nucleic acid-binding Zn-ribbon protein
LQTFSQSNKEKEALQDKFNAASNREKALQAQNQELATLHEEMKSTIATLTAERHSHTAHIGTLTAQHSEAISALQSLQSNLASQTVKLTDLEHRLQHAQSDAQASLRRADDAERSHTNLQNENVGLMASLNEMRPKLVELTEEKLNLTDRVGTLEAQKRELQAAVGKIEDELDDARAQVEAFTQEREKGESARDSEVERLKREIEEMKTHATQVEDELQGALASVRDLETERGIHRQAVERYQHEMDRLDAELAALRVQMGTLQGEAVEAQARYEQALSALEDTRVILERANAEVDSLRGDLVGREEEVAQLRDTLAAASITPEPSTKGERVRNASLGQEILAVEESIGISAAKSRIRALEAEVFDEQAKGHGLQKRIQELEHEISTRPKVLVPKNPTNGHANHTYLPHSQPPFPKISSSASQHSHTSEKTNGHVSSASPTLPANAIDEGLAPEQRHKRRVSLHMLKARIEGESRPRSTLSLQPTKEEGRISDGEMPKPTLRRTQFIDENHVFWCSCCRGDLVVL